jgi:DNA repair protein RecN (Recombination protein N)
MLRSLCIQNFITIESQSISFESGFNVITGETGAGKSLVLKALQFVFGGKLPVTVLKKKDAPLQIICTFTINEAISQFLDDIGFSLNTSDPIIIRRQLTPDGKTRCFLNDQPSTSTTLKDLSAHLFSLQNQFDQVLSPTAQLAVIDRAGNHSAEIIDLQKAYQDWKVAIQDFEQAKLANEKRQQEREFIEQAHTELSGIAPQEDEENQLLEQRQKAKNQGKNYQILNESLTLLNPEEGNQLWYKLSKKLAKLQSEEETHPLSQSLEKLIDAHQSFADQLTEQAHISSQEMDLDADQIEQRLHTLRAASRKYNCSCDELPTKQAFYAEQAQLLQGGEKDLKKHAERVQETKQQYLKLDENISKKRQDIASHLCQNVSKELPDLMLDKLKLKVSNTPLPESQWSSNGTEKIKLMVQANIDTPFTPLDQAASGGERSRLFLAFEKVTSHLKQCPTLFFDEIDKGVGGAVAHAVGQCLQTIGTHHQVIAISHAPQVAALADHHVLIEKHHYEDKTVSRAISGLSPEIKLAEISRMLSGKTITLETKAAAQSLISQTQ